MKRNFNITILLAIFAILLLGGSPVCAAAKESKIPDSAIGRNGDYCAMKSGAEGEEIFGDSGVSGESDKTAKGLNDDSGFAKKCEGGGLNFADNGKPRKSTDPVIGTKRRPDPAMERTIKVNTHPAERYMQRNLDYGMTIGIERTPGGRIWVCWVAGGDDSDAYFLLAWSDDGGDTWTDTKAVIDPHDKRLSENRRTIVGNLWCDPDGRLWLFYDVAMTYYDGRGGTWATVCDNPDAKRPRWSKPQYIGVGFTLNKPTVLSNGEWALPQSLWERGVIDAILDKGRKENIYHDAYHELDSLRSANVFISGDKGKTWTLYKGVAVPGARHDENMIVELKDGTLQMTIRSKAGFIYRTLSTDKGRTWSEAEEWQPHVNSRHFIRRLADGRLLLIRHGMTDKKLKGRSHMRAFLSDDDGRTWRGGLLLDERKGISYPDGFESPDGYIYISYDRNRSKDGEILLARFTEQDIIDKKVSSPRGVLKHIICTPGRIKTHRSKTR